MQENDFEKSIRNKLNDLHLEPSDATWQQVALELEQGKRRRRGIVWWCVAASLLLILGGGLTYMLGKGTKENGGLTQAKDVKQAPVVQQDLEVTAAPKSSAGQGAGMTEGELLQQKKNRKLNAMQQPQSETPSIATNKKSTKPAPAGQTKMQDGSMGADRQLQNKKYGSAIAIPTPKAAADNDMAAIQKNAAPAEVPMHKYYNPNAVKNVHDVANNKKLTNKPDTTAPGKTPAVAHKKPGKWSTGVTIYAGSSDNISRFPLHLTPAADANSQSSSAVGPPGGGGFNVFAVGRLQFSHGFSYGFGLFVQRELGIRFAVSLGADYHRYSATSIVGNTNSNVNLQLYDPVLSLTANVQTYYGGGTKQVFTNTYQQIELPVNVSMKVNPAAKHPFLLSLGIAPAYMAGSEALYSNYNIQAYYVQKDQFHKVNLSGSVSAMFAAVNTRRYMLSVGPAAQAGFNNMIIKSAYDEQRLTFLGMKVNLTFK